MNYIIFNHDGSIKNLNLPAIITQGSAGTYTLLCGIDGYDNDDFLCQAFFELPNGDVNSIIGTAETIHIDDSDYEGYEITLTAAQTQFAGNLRMSLRLYDNPDHILWTYNLLLTINESNYEAEYTDITMAQYEGIIESLSKFQQKYTLNNARFYKSLADAQADLTNLATNQCIILADPNNPNYQPKIYYKSAEGTLVLLNTVGQFSGVNTTATAESVGSDEDPEVIVTSSVSGETWNVGFNFKIPQGEQGPQGDPGQNGQDGRDGDYVSYFMGDYSDEGNQVMFNDAASYFYNGGQGRPYGQTCYATDNDVHEVFWFLTGSQTRLVYIEDCVIHFAFKNVNTWTNSTALSPRRSETAAISVVGLYAVSYDNGTASQTFMLSIYDMNKTTWSENNTGDMAVYNASTNKITVLLGGGGGTVVTPTRVYLVTRYIY